MILAAASIGASALQLICEIVVAVPGINFIELATLDPAPLLEKRARLGTNDRAPIERALYLRESLALPFWSAAMLAAPNSIGIPYGLFEAATFHQSVGQKLLRIPASDVRLDLLVELERKVLSSGRLVAITSLVSDEGDEAHLQMLDFHTIYSVELTPLVIQVIRSLGCRGALLRSGKSYHFYGLKLLGAPALPAFLGRALLFDPILDRAWIAHQLIEGRCALRISGHPDYAEGPVVVAIV